MRIHWFSPLPPARTDIADFTARILPALCSAAEVVLWTSQADWDADLNRRAEVRRFDPGALHGNQLNGADATFFQIGNSSRFHRDIWQVCQRYPGIAVLHDVLLHDAVVDHCRVSPEIAGVYSDGWTGERMSVAFGDGVGPRRLTVRISSPEWMPGRLSVRVLPDVDGRPDIHALRAGGTWEIVRELPAGAGRIELLFSPALSPASCHAGADPRIVACLLESAVISSPNGRVLLNGRENYCEILQSHYGPRGRRDAELHWRGVLSLDQMADAYSCVPFVLSASRAVVVHSRMAERIVRRETGLPIQCLALPAPAAEVPEPHSGPPPWRLLVFGYLGPNRGLDTILSVLHLLPDRDCFRLHIYGELHDPDPVSRQIETLGLRELVAIHGMVPEAELQAALAGAHLAINLRYPTRGEASGSQLRIWNHGLPSIVTRIGWYAELPGDTVAYVRPGSMAEDLCEQLKRYAANPQSFVQMGMSGYRHFAEQHTPERYVAGLLDLAARVRAADHNS